MLRKFSSGEVRQRNNAEALHSRCRSQADMEGNIPDNRVGNRQIIVRDDQCVLKDSPVLSDTKKTWWHTLVFCTSFPEVVLVDDVKRQKGQVETQNSILYKD